MQTCLLVRQRTQVIQPKCHRCDILALEISGKEVKDLRGLYH